LGKLSAEDLFQGPHGDINGHPLRRYDDVRLIDETQIRLSNGLIAMAPAGALATILFFLKEGDAIKADLEVYPNGTDFGFVECDVCRLLFAVSAESKKAE